MSGVDHVYRYWNGFADIASFGDIVLNLQEKHLLYSHFFPPFLAGLAVASKEKLTVTAGEIP